MEVWGVLNAGEPVWVKGESMNDKQPEALRIADALDDGQNYYAESSLWFDAALAEVNGKAAAELRRLHEENEGLLEEFRKLRETRDWQYKMAVDRISRIEKLERINAELLEALQNMVEMFKTVPTLEQNSFDEPPEPKTQWDYEAYQMIGAARAAIEKAEGRT